MEDLVKINLFNGAYKGRRVLVTGHTGFKGSWLILWLRAMGAEVTGYSLEPETDPNHFDLLGLDINSVIGDITDRKKIKEVIADVKPEIVFHLAAQSLVRRSYKNPFLTYSTNVLGSLNVYEACAATQSVRSLISATSDKVYENNETYWPFRESDRLGGNDMYSSSKACVEIMTQSFRKSFLADRRLDLITVRAGNVIGGGDWGEDRLVPDMVRSISRKQSVVLRNPTSVRPWQHVLEPLSGYLLLGQKSLEGARLIGNCWNFGPSDESFREVQEVFEIMKRVIPELAYESRNDSPAMPEAGRLTLDSSNARFMLGWKPVWHNVYGIERTARWYQENITNGKILSAADLTDYVTDAAKAGLAWATR